MRPGDLPWGVVLIDARGQRRMMYSPLSEALLPPFVVTVDGRLRRAIRDDALRLEGAPERAVRRMWRSVAELGAWALVVGVVVWWNFGARAGVVVGGIAASASAVMWVRLAWSFFPAGTLAVVAAMIRQKRCASCGHALLSSGDDGMLSCGECGAWWREDVREWLREDGA